MHEGADIMALFNSDALLDRLEFLDSPADSLQRLLGRGLKVGGANAQAVKDLLNGVWLGHPLHPALTDLPIGAWTCSTALDLMDRGQGDTMGRAADFLIGAGLVSGLGAAASGIADWHDTYGPERRTGLAHALLNTAGMGMFSGALVLRLTGRRSSARPLAVMGYLLAAAGAFLGGDMVFRLGTQVNRNAWTAGPDEWADAAAEEEVTEGAVRRCQVDGATVLLLRQQGEICALSAVCSHAGGPLEEGEVVEGTVRCPWHGSRFDLGSGEVRQGPASMGIPVFETRTTPAGRVEIRRARG